jgi:hypothetical protein
VWNRCGKLVAQLTIRVRSTAPVSARAASFRKALRWNPQLDFDPEVKAQQLARE